MNEAIRNLRQSLKLNKREFAELIGITSVYVSYLESGKKVNPSKDLLDKICKKTGKKLVIKFV